MKDGKTVSQRIREYVAMERLSDDYLAAAAAGSQRVAFVRGMSAMADEIEAEIEAARQTPKWYEEFQAFATEELERPMLDGESIKAWLERNYTERPRPDTQERIDEDAQKVTSDYWGCNDVYCFECDVCDGASPQHRYGVSSCYVAKAFDLLRRQRELDGRSAC